MTNEIAVRAKTDTAVAVMNEFGFSSAKGRTLDLGTLMPMASGVALTRLVAETRKKSKAALETASDLAAGGILSELPMAYDTFCRMAKAQTFSDRLWEDLAYEERHFWSNILDSDRHPPTQKGYVNYLCDINPQVGNAITTPVTVPLPADDRKRHTYVVGGAGSGKSELLKVLMHEEIMAGEAAVVVIDAHSDLCPQVARWPELTNDRRLVFVMPNMFEGWVPTLNPLEPPKGADDRTKEKISNRLGEAIGEICRGETGGATLRMVTLAKAAIKVLLDRPGSTFHDFHDLMGESPPEHLLQAGRSHRDLVVRKFFETDWNAGDYRASKGAMRARLTQLLLHTDFREMTCGPTTVPLQELIDGGAVVLFSLGGAGTDTAKVFGKLVVNLIAAIGDLRKETERVDRKPVHVFIDECHNFTGPATQEILTGLRKYGMHLTLANQSLSQLSEADRYAVISSTDVKLMGRTDHSPSMMERMGCNGDDGQEMARNVSAGVFLTKWGTAAPFLLSVRSDLADDSHQITQSQWIALKVSQRRYYRRFDERTPAKAAKSLTDQTKTASADPLMTLSRDLD